MRRAVRWAWNGLAALSMLLCLAALAAWPASYWRSARVVAWWGGPAAAPEAGTWSAALTSDHGHLFLVAEVESPNRWSARRGIDAEVSVSQPARMLSPRPLGLRSFGWSSLDLRPDVPVRQQRVLSPLWAWTLAFGLLPGWRALGWYRRRRKHRVGPAFEVVTREG